jgi:hypothetical protein
VENDISGKCLPDTGRDDEMEVCEKILYSLQISKYHLFVVCGVSHGL